jgi:hypothetical protein
MSDSIDNGGPAYPCHTNPLPGKLANAPQGMTLRDWFAGQERIDAQGEFGWELLEALAGPRPNGCWKTNPLGWFAWSNTWQAKVKFARADAMIAARKGGQA